MSHLLVARVPRVRLRPAPSARSAPPPVAASRRLAPLLLAILASCGGPDERTPASGTPAASPASKPASAPAAPAGAQPVAPPAPGRAAEPSGDLPPALETAESCGRCHKAIYEEWKQTYHAKAMSDPLFIDLSQNLREEECIRCHAPVPLRESPDWDTPLARVERVEEGVTCLTCHQSGDHMAGTQAGLTGACSPVEDPAQGDSTKICAACHNQHKTVDEWRDGPYGPGWKGERTVPQKDCIACHMPSVERPMVEGGKVRRGTRHTWIGSHDFAYLRDAAKLEATATVRPVGGAPGLRVQAWVTNTGAGHLYPTDTRFASLTVYVKLWDASGKVVLDPLDFLQQTRAQTATYRLNARNSNITDTQLPPLQRVSGLGDWKGYLDVPGLTSGHGEAWLVYRTTPNDVLDESAVADPTYRDYRARRLHVVPFRFGE